MQCLLHWQRAQFLAVVQSFHDSVGAALGYQKPGTRGNKRDVQKGSVVIVAPSPYKYPNGTMTVVIFVTKQDGSVLEGKALAFAVEESKHYIAAKVCIKCTQVYICAQDYGSIARHCKALTGLINIRLELRRLFWCFKGSQVAFRVILVNHPVCLVNMECAALQY